MHGLRRPYTSSTPPRLRHSYCTHDSHPSTRSHPTETRTRVQHVSFTTASGGINISTLLCGKVLATSIITYGADRPMDVRDRKQMCRRETRLAVPFFVKNSAKTPSKLVLSDRKTPSRRTRWWTLRKRLWLSRIHVKLFYSSSAIRI